MQISSANPGSHFTYFGSQPNTSRAASKLDHQDTAKQQQEIQKLKDRDQEVRAHEQAHISAAGGIALSGANFQYVTGPDGQRYATGGDVSIDNSEVPGDPQATIIKAETIRRAALAPAQPSGQDFSVASNAQAMAAKARIELLQKTAHSLNGNQQTGSLIDTRV